MNLKNSILILAGGGPAPGINTVIGTVGKCFLSRGYRVIGMHGGYKGLFTPDPKLSELDFATVDAIFNNGGSFLRMSRYKPSDEDFQERFNLKLFRDNNIKLLVTIGGDDTASTANRVTNFLKSHDYHISNIHVPKTIDNDLPLPMRTPTFGFNSAMAEGTRIAATIYEDARTSGNWFLVSSMGRSSGSLAIHIGASSHYPMIIIPEMFDKSTITLDKIIRLTISSIIKRRIMGLDYGAVIISEGVFHTLSTEEIEKSGVRFTTDEHGHIELGKVSKAQLFNNILETYKEKLGLNVSTRPVDIGYEFRCQTPVAYDLFYCTQLGCGVYELYRQGYTGCIVYVDPVGQTKPIYLHQLQDPRTGRIMPRLVDINSAYAQNIFRQMLNFITEDDYEAASKWLKNPEEYDFYKILNWKRK